MELGDFQGELDYAEDSLFQAGLLKLKSETRERKEILFQISPPKSTWGRKEFIFIAQAICAPDIGMERFTGESPENVILTDLQLN